MTLPVSNKNTTIYLQKQNFSIDGQLGTIVSQSLTSKNGSVSLSLEDRNVIILGDIEAKKNISITAKSILILGNLKTTEGDISIQATMGNIVSMGNTVHVAKNMNITAKKDFIQSGTYSDVNVSARILMQGAIAKQDGRLLIQALCDLYLGYTKLGGISLERVDVPTALALYGFQK